MNIETLNSDNSTGKVFVNGLLKSCMLYSMYLSLQRNCLMNTQL